ncbi:hypothetical protein FGE12_27670 [Aggregicoccus sp. 17bor-14]|uniref:hypothetical protein n=1 Tax=Myxococcaceae TaxID=31 RepID=UPI00129C4E32|nr:MULTISPECIES: hypothetical protein [Myxococcaceae]MBF5046226.1 hypothetical protein [Simulacricoccus sp. 17bor-14]MRI91950.1 hypothetical protein [Aggregicoccus sp. 17bor-14]
MLPALLLLLAAAAPASASPKPHTVTALLVDAEFVCARRTLAPLVLLPEAEAQLQVPADCPGAGGRWGLRVACAGGRCTGNVREGERVVADVEGPRPRKGRAPAPLALTPRPGLASASLAALQQLQLSATGEQALQVDPRAELARPLRVAFRGQSFTYAHPLEPGRRTPLEPRQDAPGVSLSAQAERLDAGHVRLRLWTAAGALLLERTLALGEGTDFPCARSGGWCAEAVRVGVELLPHQPLKP